MSELKKDNYILKSDAENDRLDRQSRMKAFDFKEELKHLSVFPGAKVLDAGCGTGIVTDYLSKIAPQVEVTGWDFSAERLTMAENKYGAANITFEQKNLLELDIKTPLFDVIVCRFVLRHFDADGVQKVMQNLFNVLKPGGVFYVVDVEGLMTDVYPCSDFLKTSLKNLREAKAVSLEIARKLPYLFSESGYQNIDWHVQTSLFKGEELSQEIENLRQSIRNGEAFISNLLGGTENYKRLEDEYFAALSAPHCVLFYNKVITTGVGSTTKQGE